MWVGYTIDRGLNRAGHQTLENTDDFSFCFKMSKLLSEPPKECFQKCVSVKECTCCKKVSNSELLNNFSFEKTPNNRDIKTIIALKAFYHFCRTVVHFSKKNMCKHSV